MASLVHPLLADAVVNALAVFAVGFVSYLLWLRFREKRTARRQQRERDRDRRSHWGYV